MANSSAEINKKRCVKCDGENSGGGVFTCNGCQQIFCERHVSEHRQELTIQLENTIQVHDYVQHESNISAPDEALLKKIDVWEKESIITIQTIAERTRSYLHQWYQTINDEIKAECTELGKNLRTAHEIDNFSEVDLTKWNQILNRLKAQLELMTKVHIVEDKQCYINMIKIQQKIHWLSNVSLLKYSNPVIMKYLKNNSIQWNKNLSEDQDLQNFTRSKKLKRTQSNDNRDKDSTCK